jgi:hypothetical protein
MVLEQSQVASYTWRIESWTDSSWDDVKPSRKSTNCHYIACNNAPVHWRSKVASILAPTVLWGENNGYLSFGSHWSLQRKEQAFRSVVSVHL